jgi:hypothetical protein
VRVDPPRPSLAERMDAVRRAWRQLLDDVYHVARADPLAFTLGVGFIAAALVFAVLLAGVAGGR